MPTDSSTTLAAIYPDLNFTFDVFCLFEMTALICDNNLATILCLFEKKSDVNYWGQTVNGLLVITFSY